MCKLQDWVKHNGLRVIVVFEGRDGAGKGGTIRAITERVSPRVFRVRLAPMSSAHRTRAIAALCEELNKCETLFPGSQWRLHYAIRESS